MSPTEQTGCAVMIVEDNLDTRDALAFALRYAGYRVTAAADGAEALNLLHNSTPPDLILLDLLMPTMDGRELRRRLKEDPALASIPVVVVSAVGDAAAEAQNLDADAVLCKSADLQTLFDTVRKFCHKEAENPPGPQ